MRVVGIHRVYTPSIILTYDASLKYLSELGKLEYKSVPLKYVTSEILNWGDVFFFGRSDSKMELKIARKLKKAGKHNLIYVLDDDLLNVPATNACSCFFNSDYVKSVVSEMISLCPILASPSRKILEKYGECKKTILLEEPALLQTKFHEHDSKIIKIGYAGSLDHTSDVDGVIFDVLSSLKKEFADKIEIEFFGAKPTNSKVLKANYINYEPNYLSYLNSLCCRNWDIALAPLQDVDFNNYKHYIKIIEYMSIGAVPVASNVYIYREMRDKYSQLILVDNTYQDWYSAIKQLICSNDLQNQRKSLFDFTVNFQIEQIAPKLYFQIKNIFESSNNKSACFHIPSYFCERLIMVYKIYGVVGVIKKIIDIHFNHMRE